MIGLIRLYYPTSNNYIASNELKYFAEVTGFPKSIYFANKLSNILLIKFYI